MNGDLTEWAEFNWLWIKFELWAYYSVNIDIYLYRILHVEWVEIIKYLALHTQQVYDTVSRKYRELGHITAYMYV